MIGDWEPFAHPYANRTLAIDSNLMLLLVVGGLDPNAISRFKRTQKFEVQDFETLSYIVRFFAARRGLSTTPHVLTEVGTFLGRRKDLRALLGGLIRRTDEHREAASALVQGRFYHEFGLTDAALCDLALKEHCILTTDGSLSARIARVGGAVINDNHIQFPV